MSHLLICSLIYPIQHNGLYMPMTLVAAREAPILRTAGRLPCFECPRNSGPAIRLVNALTWRGLGKAMGWFVSTMKSMT